MQIAQGKHLMATTHILFYIIKCREPTLSTMTSGARLCLLVRCTTSCLLLASSKVQRWNARGPQPPPQPPLNLSPRPQMHLVHFIDSAAPHRQTLTHTTKSWGIIRWVAHDISLEAVLWWRGITVLSLELLPSVPSHMCEYGWTDREADGWVDRWTQTDVQNNLHLFATYDVLYV